MDPKKIGTLICWMVLALFVQGQNPILDSLNLVLEQSESDSEKVMLLTQLAKFTYQTGGPPAFDAANAYLDQADELAHATQDPWLITQPLMSRSALHFFEGKLEEAGDYSVLTVAEARKTNDSLLIARALYNLSSYKLTLGDYATGLESSLEAVLLYEALGRIDHMAKAYANIGSAYTFMGNDSLGLDYMIKSTTYFEEVGNPFRIALSYGNLASTYSDMEAYPLALEYQLKALAIDTELDPDGRGHWFDKVSLGGIYMELGQLDSALYHLEQAYAKGSKIEEDGLLCNSRHLLALTLLKNPSSNKQDLRRARNLLQTSIEECGQYHQADQLNSLLALPLYYARIGDQDSVLYATKNYKKTLENYFNVGQNQKVSELRTRYDLGQKELRLAQAQEALAVEKLEKEKAWSNLLIIVFVAVALGLAASLIILWLYFQVRRRKAEQVRQELVFNRHRMDLENQALRARMNPHFLFNCLNSIQSLYLDGETEKAHDYLVDFGRLMRKVLEYSEKSSIQLAEELDLARLYISLEKVRLEDDIEFWIDMDETIDQFNIPVSPLLLQPLLENAIWHGITPLDRQGQIGVVVRQEAADLQVLIHDNGVGIAENSITKHQGTPHGLNLVGDRLALVGGSMEIQNRKERDGITGTFIQLTIPLSYD